MINVDYCGQNSRKTLLLREKRADGLIRIDDKIIRQLSLLPLRKDIDQQLLVRMWLKSCLEVELRKMTI